jgi:uncharacterized protein
MIIQTVFGLLLALSDVQDSEALRFVYTTEQGFDTSCGLTTLACLMNNYWGIETTEIGLAQQYFSERILKGEYTISFADMARILKAQGFNNAAYKMNYMQLATAVSKYAPVIVHYNRPEGHFALVLAILDGIVVTSDPAEGTIAQERGRFEQLWSGYVLLAAMPSAKVKKDIIQSAIQLVIGRRKMLDRAALVSVGAERW